MGLFLLLFFQLSKDTSWREEATPYMIAGVIFLIVLLLIYAFFDTWVRNNAKRLKDHKRAIIRNKALNQIEKEKDEARRKRKFEKWREENIPPHYHQFLVWGQPDYNPNVGDGLATASFVLSPFRSSTGGFTSKLGNTSNKLSEMAQESKLKEYQQRVATLNEIYHLLRTDIHPDAHEYFDKECMMLFDKMSPQNPKTFVSNKYFIEFGLRYMKIYPSPKKRALPNSWNNPLGLGSYKNPDQIVNERKRIQEERKRREG